MKIFNIFLLLLLPFLGFANMANPTVYGSKPVNLYPLRDCSVQKENIRLRIVQDLDEKILYGKYNVTYKIFSETNKQVPLVFVGFGMNDGEVTVNGKKITSKKVNEKNTDFIHRNINNNLIVDFGENKDYDVQEDDLLYFVANLKKGENIIIVDYNADFEYNRTHFLRTYHIAYSLYPSKFWKSFENVEFEIESEIPVEIKSSNIGNPKLESGKFLWKIENFDKDLEIKFTQKHNWFTNILLTIEPFGIAAFVSLICVVIHLLLLKRHRKKQPNKFSWIKLIGMIINPLIFFFFGLYSFDFIDWISHQKTYHYLSFIPVFLLSIVFFFLYAIMVWIMDKYFKKTTHK